MKVYFVTIFLLTKAYCSYGQEKQITDPARKDLFNITLRSLSQSPTEEQDDNNASGNTLQVSTENATENCDEINNQTKKKPDTEILKEDKNIKNKIRIFDMETKQYITVDFPKPFQTKTNDTLNAVQTETYHAALDSNNQNIDVASESENKIVYLVNDSVPQTTTKSNDTSVQKIDKTNNESNDSKSVTIHLENYSTTQKVDIEDSKNKSIHSLSNNSNTNSYSIKGVLVGQRDRSIDFISYCDHINEVTCVNVEVLRKVECGDGTNIPLDKLCNGYPDCPNRTDEEKCKQQVHAKLQLASNILLDAELLNECLTEIAEGNTFLEELRTWRVLLKTEWEHYNFNFKESCEIINLIFDLFDVHICEPIERYDVVTKSFIKTDTDFELLMDHRDILDDTDWSPTSCICNHQFCKSDYCDNRCRRVCWQLYALDHFGCQSLTGATSISLDYVCDGKIDCRDETDETSCMRESPAYKHKANSIYDELLKMLTAKDVSKKYDPKKIKQLIELIHQLQQLTTRTSNPDRNTIKILRDKYFKLLVSMFKSLLPTVNVMHELNHAHDFLLSLNEKMVKALKSSYTGNKYVVSLAGCLCKNGVCASVACSRKCTKFCLDEPRLTKYICNANNTFVNIEAICDGNKDCPNGEDEKHCKREACRARQFDMLRIALQKAGKLLRDIVFQKVLKVWKAKIAELNMISINEEPNRKTLQNKIGRILGIILEIYLSMTQITRSGYFDVKEFINVSNIIKQILHSCSN